MFPGGAMQDVVLTIVGPDRPGLVEAIAEAVARSGGNWLESRMAHLAGTFAGVLRVQAPAEAVPRVVAAIEELSHIDLKVTVAPGIVSETLGPQRLLDLDLIGLDRAGIVRDISAILARHGANIEELVTDVSSAPMSGEPLFRAQVRLKVPAAADADPLRTDLERFATDLMVELRLVETVTQTSVRSRHGARGRRAD
jgi:glycine cleavage system regulatory protein